MGNFEEVILSEGGNGENECKIYEAEFDVVSSLAAGSLFSGSWGVVSAGVSALAALLLSLVAGVEVSLAEVSSVSEFRAGGALASETVSAFCWAGRAVDWVGTEGARHAMMT